MDLKSLEAEAKREIKKAKSLKELDEIFKKYLGKKGEITRLLKSLKNLSEKERKSIGKEANRIKNFLEGEIKKK